MTQQNHPIISPPPELVHQWAMAFECQTDAEVFAQVAHWGAAREFEACYDWLKRQTFVSYDELLWGLLRFRKPKPPSLKERALSEVAAAVAGGNITPERGATIRLALEALPDD